MFLCNCKISLKKTCETAILTVFFCFLLVQSVYCVGGFRNISFPSNHRVTWAHIADAASHTLFLYMFVQGNIATAPPQSAIA